MQSDCTKCDFYLVRKIPIKLISDFQLISCYCKFDINWETNVTDILDSDSIDNLGVAILSRKNTREIYF
jgi:hypothetical protein